MRLAMFWVVAFTAAMRAEAEERAFASSSVATPEGCVQLEVTKPKGEHDLAKALARARDEGKFLFIQYGRENCTNCQKVWNMLGDGRVVLPDDFLYADISCDDSEMRTLFELTVAVDDDGLFYPYVAILAPDGEQLAFKSGLGTPEGYRAMIRRAREDVATP